jgi:hypothetical protein
MNLGFIILILFLLIIIFSLILAKDKSSKVVKIYWRRVPYYFIAIMILVCVTVWLFLLPILGVLFLIKY